MRFFITTASKRETTDTLPVTDATLNPNADKYGYTKWVVEVRDLEHLLALVAEAGCAFVVEADSGFGDQKGPGIMIYDDYLE